MTLSWIYLRVNTTLHMIVFLSVLENAFGMQAPLNRPSSCLSNRKERVIFKSQFRGIKKPLWRNKNIIYPSRKHWYKCGLLFFCFFWCHLLERFSTASSPRWWSLHSFRCHTHFCAWVYVEESVVVRRDTLKLR